ncbi:hypothetical protein [Flavobacterium celericrescens]|uniref:Uncharacterized protein n=1 Tax=Flavobacterium celericrescens TaxID=2709780 RepID=A0ABX0IEN2_9FLAO|nr:hypothetical protein [Flavobacterium celericrescens]NHM04319.1 hypothetical protein [Flavobacterium celericrescens]
MGIEIIATLISALLGGLLPLTKTIAKKFITNSVKAGKVGKTEEFIAKVFDLEINETKTYKQRLEDTLTILKSAFAEVDKATIEFTDLMKEKEKNIDELEQRLSKLSTEESSLKNKVETLQKVPLEALDHFETILNKGDKRSALRDYLLFISGIIASVIVTLILKFYFNI